MVKGLINTNWSNKDQRTNYEKPDEYVRYVGLQVCWEMFISCWCGSGHCRVNWLFRNN